MSVPDVAPPAGTYPRDRVLRWHGQRARIEVAVDQGGAPRACIVPESFGAPLGAAFVARCVESLANDGVHRVVSPAITEADARGFLQAGFETTARLHLLTHDLDPVPAARPNQPATLRGAWSQRTAVLDVDAAAFSAEWRFDEAALRGALSATPQVRLRTCGTKDQPTGYAVTGRSGRRGYLQRLAVHPSVQGQGCGRALVRDALHWCARWRVRRVVVNTHEGNDRALALYRSVGFAPSATRLVVVTYTFEPRRTPTERDLRGGLAPTGPSGTPAPPATPATPATPVETRR